MQLDLVAIFSLIVSFQLFFTAFFLLTLRKGRARSNRLLGIFFLLLAINMADLLLQINGVVSFLPLFFLLDDASLLLYGPLLYLYTKSVVRANFSFHIRDVLHFVPFLICFLGLLVIYSFAEVTYSDSLGTVSQSNVPKSVSILLALCYLHGALYLWSAKRLLSAYDNYIREQYSNLGKLSLKWLHFILNSFIVIWFLGLLLSLVPFTSYRSLLWLPLLGFVIFLFYFINRVVLQALRKPELFASTNFSGREKYKGSGLSESQRAVNAKALVYQMENKELYLNPDLSIAEVAQILKIPPKELSQTINQSFQLHFFDFVNRYRIEAAKRLLADSSEDLTIQQVMYSVGFSSKSSFNTVFKKLTNLTPSRFRAIARKESKKGSLS